MPLSVATEFDEESNTLCAKTDELGTYCALDLEVLMQNLGIKPDYTSEKIVMQRMYKAVRALCLMRTDIQHGFCGGGSC